MLAAIRTAVSLLKLRIGLAIAASAAAGMAAANGPAPSPWRMLGVGVAVLGASGAAGAFNHYYERDLDRLMVRTRNRPFASRRLRESRWWPAGFLILLLAALALGVAAGGPLSAIYVLLGAFTYGVVYTVWLKRRSAWNIVVGGLAGSFAVLAGAAAVSPAPQPVSTALAVALFLWTPPHFWSLAAARHDDYAAAGVPMLPITVPTRTWTLAILAHAVLLLAVTLLPLAYGEGAAYGLCAGAGGGLFVWRSWRLHRTPSREAAMASFLASLQQLGLLVAGVLLDGVLEHWP